MYQHKYLSSQEKEDFINLYKNNIKNNIIMKNFLENKIYVLIYPAIIIGLSILTMVTHINFPFMILSFFMGIVTIQLTFIFSHLWAHSLMLEYSLWNINNMEKDVGQIPSVMFFAFYHHHHTKEDDWYGDISIRNNNGALSTAFSHWESFSLFTTNYPVNGTIMKLFLVYNLYFFPFLSPFFLGYELGVILLPISHDWVHEKNATRYGIYYLLQLLEMIGVFATNADHIRHHIYSHDTIYQGFTSSGIYSKRFDTIVDDIWNYFYHKYNTTQYKMYSALWYLMTFVLCGTLTISTFVLKYIV